MKNKPAILPIPWLLIFLLLQVLLDYRIPLLDLLNGSAVWLGLLPLLAGLWIMISGASAFRRAETPLIPFETSTSLVISGPFRYTRNPMYLGMVLILTGTALLLGSLAALLPVPVFILLIRHQYVLPEEQMMKAIFKEEYAEYCQAVRRWL